MKIRLFGAWPGWSRAGLAFGLGAVIASGQAPLGQWPLALTGLAAGLMLVAQARSAPAAAWTGLFIGGGHFALALSWIIEPFLIEPEVYAWMIPFVLILLPFGLGLFWALAAGIAHRFGATYAHRVLLFAVTLTAAELTRGYIFTGFPWAMIGHIFIDTPIAHLATFAGAGGLTLLAVLVTGLPVALGGRWIAVPILSLFVATVWGDNLQSPAYPADLTIVRLVQPNAEQSLKWDPDRAQDHMDRLLELTTAPGPNAPPDMVVWPETSVPYLLNNNDDILRVIGRAGQGAPVAFGIQRVDGNRGYNTLAVVDQTGRLTQLYDKHHLVPFGEYIPFGDIAYDLFGITAFAAQQGAGYSAGPGAAVLDLGPKLGRILPLICYEAVFPQDLRAAPIRADWILHITNDAWFGTLTGPWQHLAQARLRAIEQGLPLLRAANTGVSAVIDARGRVVAKIPLGRAAFIDAALPPPLPPTLYARHGDLPLVLLLLGTVLALVSLRPRRRA
ncbi:Apolipoprotein N-acyltransferase [Pseudorhodobacter antarcticus]|uniref:Apolipoprotein N-acyltransferase n=1 Tax=Pseudorhodobacter antarcticus TaxID=1077947 RepID=A0A1H8EVQ4_9RHOB|nr:apolipoprotein N-acyltransferase [Pseudorhodobacter antarcticus]SEN23711.1 Apolipoprotein N-acyltransferase [Pseudorhodobacter antarcticus]